MALRSNRKTCTPRFRGGVMRSTGNANFDAYKNDTLRRLEDEQQNFEAFLQRLRDARDKAQFDAFMKERAKSAAAPQTSSTQEN